MTWCITRQSELLNKAAHRVTAVEFASAVYLTYKSQAQRMGHTYGPSGRALVVWHMACSGHGGTCCMHIDTLSFPFGLALTKYIIIVLPEQ